MKKDIYISNDDNFYKNIKKYKDKNCLIHFLYCDKDIIDDSLINNYDEKEIREKIQVVTASNIKNIEDRYSYIYDVVCSFLDNEFNDNNICQFENNQCISVRNNGHCPESKNGCCYGTKRGLCKNFVDGRCIIKSISCKLFTCRYLRKNNIKYNINDIFLLKNFFNIKQKFIISNSIFKDKEEIMDLLLKNRY